LYKPVCVALGIKTFIHTMQHQNNEPPGELFRLLLSLRGIKQTAAASKLDVRQQYVSKLVKCKCISPKKFAVIVAAFKFSAEEIEMAKKFLPPTPQ
jgi:plasmid maintenance system antidote protein VapI